MWNLNRLKLFSIISAAGLVVLEVSQHLGTNLVIGSCSLFLSVAFALSCIALAHTDLPMTRSRFKDYLGSSFIAVLVSIVLLRSVFGRGTVAVCVLVTGAYLIRSLWIPAPKERSLDMHA